MTQHTLELTDASGEVESVNAVGFGNFAYYLDLLQLQDGDVVRIKQKLDLVGTGSPKILNNVDLSWQDIQDAGDEGSGSIPFNLEADQVGRFSIELIETLRVAPYAIAVPYRLSNLQGEVAP